MKERIPGVPTAQGSGRLLHPSIPVEQYATPACPVAELGNYSPRTILRYRYISEVTRAIDLSPVTGQSYEDWNKLAEAAATVSGNAIEENCKTTPHQLTQREYDETSQLLLHDSRAGAMQMVAFLEVIPRVLFKSDFADSNDSITKAAARSRPTILAWSKLSEYNDATLTYGVSYPKPPVISEHPHDHIRFHDKWFEAQEDGSVGLKASKLQDVRNENDKKLRLQPRDNKQLFGCPAVYLIPDMYDALTQAASSSGLFAKTYMQTRASSGYAELWDDASQGLQNNHQDVL